MTSNHLHTTSSAFNINAHMLEGEKVTYQSSPNHSGLFKRDLPDTVIIHFTAGSSLASSVDVMTNSNNKVSAHIVIGRTGDVVQLVPFNKVAWHAGKSEWQGRSKLNQYAIGIELDNAGQLQPNGNGSYLSWYGGHFSGHDVYKGVHRNQYEPTYWHCYTEAQIMQTFTLCQALCQHYFIKAILGHEEVSPGRKVDPGPAFPLDKLRNRLLPNNSEVSLQSAVFPDTTDINRSENPEVVIEEKTAISQAITTATKLNVRSGPGAQFSMVSEPLSAGALVNVVKQQGNWVQVVYENTGWVAAKYITPVVLPQKHE